MTEPGCPFQPTWSAKRHSEISLALDLAERALHDIRSISESGDDAYERADWTLEQIARLLWARREEPGQR